MLSQTTVFLKRGVYVEIATVVWVLIEGTVALGSGILAHSLSLVALGADSFIELAAALVLLWRLSIEARGAEAERVENAEKTAGWMVGIALLLLAVYILGAAIHELWTRTGAESSVLGLGLAVISSILMPILSSMKRRIGATLNSPALIADSSSSLVCGYMAWTVLVGVALTTWFGWWWADSIAALVLLVFVVREGIEAIEEARGLDD